MTTSARAPLVGRKPILLLTIGVVATFSESCGVIGLLAPPPGLSHATAIAACAPNDGPAVHILLSSVALDARSPVAPYIQALIWRSRTELIGTWDIAPPAYSKGYALRVSTAGDYSDVAVSGTVTILAVRADGTVVGNVDLVFQPGERVRGGFTAEWDPRVALCG